MRAATIETINASQLATTTDRLLAYGGFSKRRGPHVAQARGTSVPAEIVEQTFVIRRRPGR